MYTTITDTHPKALQSEKISTPLKPHQLSMIHEMNKLELNSFKYNNNNTIYDVKTSIGILADSVGSGKTLSILGLISNNTILPTSKTKYTSFNNIISMSIIEKKYVYIPINIIIVPHSIILQWSNIIKNQTKLKYYIVNNKKSYEGIKKMIIELGGDEEYSTNYDSKLHTVLSKYDIILVSSTFYNKFYVYLNEYRFNVSRIIFDEADTIKIPSCSTINASFSWFVSSSYMNLVYPKGTQYKINLETENIFHNSFSSEFYDSSIYRTVYINGINHSGYIKNTMLLLQNFRDSYDTFAKTLILKNDDNYIKESFRLPDFTDNYIICEYPLDMTIIKDVVSQEVLNLLNAGNVAGAIEKLHCVKVKDNDNLIELVTENLNKELHNAQIEYDMKSLQHYQNEAAKKLVLDNIKDKIDIIKAKVEHIKAKVIDEANCPICYDTVENKTIMKCCNTGYCLECITVWLSSHKKTSCPLCRAKISINDYIIVNPEYYASEKKKEEIKCKIYYLKKFFEKKKDSKFKVLIFADWYESFFKITEVLSIMQIKYSMIKGTSASINNTIAKYKSDGEDRIDVLMLNSNFCGSGINLENTTDIVIFHNMSKEKNTQIIGRAQRPGRTSNLNIIRLCYDNEVKDIKDISNNITPTKCPN
jgi:hypothetical protein